MQPAITQPSTNGSSASLQPTTIDSKHAPPRHGTTSKTAFEPHRVPSRPSRPSESWETAYLFAFIYRFTSLCHTLKTGLKLRTVQDLEQILETDTRTIQSETSEQPDSNTNVTDAKEILTEILTTFHDNLKTVNLNSWSKWLKNFVEEIIKYESLKPSLSILKWPQNYISTRPNGFWDLDWLEKLHLLRILVDHQLTYSFKIRTIVDENYEKSSSKVSKQQSTTSASTKADTSKPIQNQLLIKPLGLDRNLKTWWQIDDSPRIYSSGNPYKSDCTWTVLSSSQAEFTELTSKLSVDPETAGPKQSSNSIKPNSVSNESSSASNKTTIPAMFNTKNRKKKNVPQDLTLQLEWKLSQAMTEIALNSIEAGKQRVQNLLKEKEKIEEREMKKQRKIALVNSRAPLTRETPGFGVRSRLRSQVTRPDYVVDSEEIDRQLERVLRASEGSKNGGSDPGRKCKGNKRKRKGRTGESQDSDSDGSDYQTGSLLGTNEADDTVDDDDDAPARKRGSGTKKAAATQGERRSMRVRTKMNEMEEEAKLVIEEEAQPQPSTWSRGKATMSPSISESLEQSCTDPTETNGDTHVWSRGKLSSVGGENRDTSKTSEEKPESARDTKDTGADGLSALRARLATIGCVDDDEDGFEPKPKAENLSTDDQNRGEPSRLESDLDGLVPTGTDAQPPGVGDSLVSPQRSPPQSIQIDHDNHPAPSPSIHTEPCLIHNCNPQFLPSIV